MIELAFAFLVGAMSGVLVTLILCALGLSSKIDDDIEAMRRSGG